MHIYYEHIYYKYINQSISQSINQNRRLWPLDWICRYACAIRHSAVGLVVVGVVVAVSSVVVTAAAVRRVGAVSAAIAGAAVVVVRTAAVVAGAACGTGAAVDHRQRDDENKDSNDHSGNWQPVRCVTERVRAARTCYRRAARHYCNIQCPGPRKSSKYRHNCNRLIRSRQTLKIVFFSSFSCMADINDLTWPLLPCTASEVTTLWRDRNMYIIITVLILLFFYPRYQRSRGILEKN